MFQPKNKQEEMVFLIYKISRLVRERTATSGSDIHELSMLQLNCLMTLSKPATMSHVATQLRVKLPTASALVDKLVEKKYVTRNTLKNDRRIIMISLTPKGKTTLNRNLKAKMKRIEFLINVISPADRIVIFKILNQVYQALDPKKSL